MTLYKKGWEVEAMIIIINDNLMKENYIKACTRLSMRNFLNKNFQVIFQIVNNELGT